MAEYEPTEGLTTLYDFEPYTKNIKIFHQHQADAKNRNIVLEIEAVYKRLLDDPDPDDCVYLDTDDLDEDIVQ